MGLDLERLDLVRLDLVGFELAALLRRDLTWGVVAAALGAT